MLQRPVEFTALNGTLRWKPLGIAGLLTRRLSQQFVEATRRERHVGEVKVFICTE